jgi:hypothetical protein
VRARGVNRGDDEGGEQSRVAGTLQDSSLLLVLGLDGVLRLVVVDSNAAPRFVCAVTLSAPRHVLSSAATSVLAAPIGGGIGDRAGSGGSGAAAAVTGAAGSAAAGATTAAVDVTALVVAMQCGPTGSGRGAAQEQQASPRLHVQLSSGQWLLVIVDAGFASPLVSRALHGLESLLPAATAAALRVDAQALCSAAAAAAVAGARTQSDVVDVRGDIVRTSGGGGGGGGGVAGGGGATRASDTVSAVARLHIACEDSEWAALVALLQTLWCAAAGATPGTDAMAAGATAVRASGAVGAPGGGGGDDAWSRLLASEFHGQYVARDPALTSRLFPGVLQGVPSPQLSASVTLAPASTSASTSATVGSLALATCVEDVQACAPALFAALHWLYEELQLDTLAAAHLSPLARLLCGIAHAARLPAWVEAYVRDFGWLHAHPFASLLPDGAMLAGFRSAFAGQQPPCVLQWLRQRVEGGAVAGGTSGTSGAWPAVTAATVPVCVAPRIRAVVQLFEVLLPADAAAVDESCRAAVLVMASAGVSVHDVLSLPFGVAMPLLDAVHRCRSYPPTNWPVAAYALIGREDLVRVAHGSPGDRGGGAEGGKGAIDVSRCVVVAAASSSVAYVCALRQRWCACGVAMRLVDMHDGYDDLDGFATVQRLVPLRFGRDQRLQEAGRMLSSSTPALMELGEQSLCERGCAVLCGALCTGSRQWCCIAGI